VLILTRKVDQAVLIPAFGIVVRVLSITGSRVQLGITAAGMTAIIREEIAERYGYRQDGGARAAAEPDGRAADREAAGHARQVVEGGRAVDSGDGVGG